jgi:hypothetical protein
MRNVYEERSRQMPHSLRAKLSGLRYKGILEDKDYKRLCKALDNEDVLEQIRVEIDEIEISGQIDEHTSFIRTGDSVKKIALDIIDKYR